MSIRQQVDTLRPLVGKLLSGDRAFAESLINQWDRKGRLSQPQQLWVDKMIEKANAPRPEPTQIELGTSLKPLHDLFMKAKGNKIQFPKIKTKLEDGTAVELSLAGVESRNAGKVYIKLAGDWYGKVDSDGHLEVSPRRIVCEELHTLVKEIGENPSATGKVHGQKWDNCMFCGRGLQTKDSVYYGYGPICAEKWGLEWGIARERIAEKSDAVANEAFKGMVSKFFG